MAARAKPKAAQTPPEPIPKALPCAHCGSEAKVSRLAGWGQVRCSDMRNCNARLEVDGGMLAAVKAWNKRTK